MSRAVDLWVNLLPGEVARQFLGQKPNEGIESFFGSKVEEDGTPEGLVALFDALDVETGVLTGGLSTATEDFLAHAEKHPGRILVAGMVETADKPSANARRVRELSQHPRFALVRVAPLIHQIPINSRLYYPIYAACEEAGIPVSINVGIPGPRVRSECQNPVHLEDLLIDFPDLVVIGAHMGHPFEALLMQYMLKWPNLYLSNSAYLAKYMDEALVRFMGSSRGMGRVLFASDHPFLPLPRAIEAARRLPLGDDAKAAYLGGAARRLLARSLA